MYEQVRILASSLISKIRFLAGSLGLQWTNCINYVPLLASSPISKFSHKNTTC